MLTRFAPLVACVMLGCPNSDPGFDVVRVPETAYLTPDASHGDGGRTLTRDAGSLPLIVCIPELEEPGEEDKVATDYTSCPLEHEGRNFDSKATERHRKKDDESAVCCYRRGVVSSAHEE